MKQLLGFSNGWYDEYAHGLIDRRTFMSRLTGLVAIGFSMSALTSALMPNYAEAEQVSFNDSDIKAKYAKFPSPKGRGEGPGYLGVPANVKGKAPAVKGPLMLHFGGLDKRVNATWPDYGKVLKENEAEYVA